MNKIMYIRSGGQTGVDRAALDIARKHNIPIIGWCPKNGWAEDMPSAPGIRALFPELKETPSEDVSQRTTWNARDSHATLVINPIKSSDSKGTLLTKSAALDRGRPCLEVSSVDDVPKIMEWLSSLPLDLTLNVGGPRASEAPEAYQCAVEILEAVLKELQI